MSRTRTQASTVAHDSGYGSERPSIRHLGVALAVIFCSLVALHAPVLRLPYFWDEAGYFVPAAFDLLHTGDLIPHTTLSNAHPPLVMIWLALWWKLFGFAPLVTRLSMLLVASIGLLGFYRLGVLVANRQVAAVSVALSTIYSVIFAQSSLAQLDIAVLAFTAWAVYFYLSDQPWKSVACCGAAMLTKETAIVVPLTFFAFDLFSWIAARRNRVWAGRWFGPAKPLLRTVVPLLALLPLVLWYGYHFHRTGHIFGNPEYLRYNVGATLSPLRIVVAFVMRLWHALGYMNLFVLTGAALVAMRMPPVVDDGQERPRIAPSVQIVFGLLVLAHAAQFAVLGGAVLARYMIPVIPLVVLLCVSTLRRRVPQWFAWCGAVALLFVVALVVNPPWGIAPEDNLAYSDFVRIHQSAARYVEQHYAQDRILTAWPASDELNRPFLGYVSQPHTVVHVENFALSQMIGARQQRENFDIVVIFNTKYQPPNSLMSHFGWWRRFQERYFDFHSDISAEQAAQLLGGRIAWHATSGGQWIAIIEIDKIRNA
jgi:hypothetical protein